MPLIQGNIPGAGTIEISQLPLPITLGQHVLQQCRTPTGGGKGGGEGGGVGVGEGGFWRGKEEGGCLGGAVEGGSEQKEEGGV